MFIQTNGAIRSGEKGSYYDFSYTHLKEAIDNSLLRLEIPYIDSYLLHRPDIFMDNEVD